MQAFNKIVYRPIPTTWLALFRKCSKAAKIISFTLMLAPTSLPASAQSMTFGCANAHKIFYAEGNFGAKRLIFVMM